RGGGGRWRAGGGGGGGARGRAAGPGAARGGGGGPLRGGAAAAPAAARQRELAAEAERACERYLQAGSPDAAVYRARARARLLREDFDGARDDYHEVLRLQPDDAGAYTARGWIYLLHLRLARLAQSDFTEALKRAPDSADALVGRGSALVELGKVREALADADRAVNLAPEAPEPLYHAARVYAQAPARTPAERNRYERRALDLLRRSLEAGPAAEGPPPGRDLVHEQPAFRALRGGSDYLKLEKQALRPSR